MTPLASFDPLDMQPVVYPDDQMITLSVTNDRARPTSIYADGDPVIEHSLHPIEISIKKSDKTIQLYQTT